MSDWKYKDGKIISCTEKVKILDENLQEVEQIVQDSIDDAVLMGCDIEEIKQIFINKIQSLDSEYNKK